MTNRIIKTYDVSTGQTLVAIEDLIVAQTAATSLARQVCDLKTDLAETERERARLVDLERTTAHQLERVAADRDELREFLQFAMANAVFSDGYMRIGLLKASGALGLSPDAADRVVTFFQNGCRP
ncbi:hypothetical protein BJD60_gp59 [Gordonia phage Schnabeltier]|uniref:Uncharacterized protein n=1 Tax=Gordonia phage Schnabeltier TaxID=1821561 RepID=A0A142KA47_9CAUD|nr:hypothetical protein BJD60_gp59 [Gordonia phage Schnabeltier]AMS02980.1 hypothetical protein SEA_SCHNABELTIER_59 [Gordonia phage Schnabeltier]